MIIVYCDNKNCNHNNLYGVCKKGKIKLQYVVAQCDSDDVFVCLDYGEIQKKTVE